MPPDASGGEPAPITPEQLREARAALGWSSQRLAARSGNTKYGVIKYERFGKVISKRGQPPNFDGLASIRAALEAAGIEFTYGDQPGVKWPRLMVEEIPVPITPHQMRDARLLLGWSHQRLSNATRTTVNFIQGYEKFGRISRLNLRRYDFDGLAVIRGALEQAGVEFIAENDDGLGVRLRRPE